jgi:8-oxo-dGTP diphosphatase
MFSVDGLSLALIVKNKPDWQKGLLNGIGGKIEDQDIVINDDYNGISTPTQSLCAMIREFQEETGVEYRDWNLFLNMSGNNTDENKTPFSVDFYRCFTDEVYNIRSTTDEEVIIVMVNQLLSLNTIDNLKWIILLALDKNPKITKTVY